MRRFDIAVVGGGPAGSVAALLLARAGLMVALVNRPRPRESLRRVGECLPGAARNILSRLQLLHVVEGDAHLTSYGNLSAWGSDRLISSDFIYDPAGPGWHLDRVRFDRDLCDEAVAAGAGWIEDSVRFVRRHDSGFLLSLETGEMIAERVIDASGRSARVALDLGGTIERADGLMALYGWTEPGAGDEDQDTRALIEAAPDGWWYTARLADGARVVAYHTEAPNIGDLQRDPLLWREHLEATRYVREALGGREVSGWRCVPAMTQRLDCYAGEGWCAAGDAAMAFDPLSSQGIFNALYTGMKSAEAMLSESPDAWPEFSARLDNIYLHYLEHRSQYYMAETRWAHRPFWHSRLFGVGDSVVLPPVNG